MPLQLAVQMQLLAASLFHYKELEIRELKRYLRERGLPMRL